MEWSEPFYKHQASAWLGGMIDILISLKRPITIRTLRSLLTDTKELGVLEDEIAKLSDKDRAKDLISRLKSTVKSSRENLDGLLSQLRDLDNLDFGELFEPREGMVEIKLEEVINKSQVAYFQLNTMAYETAAKVIGRLILQDIWSAGAKLEPDSLKI